MVLSAKKGYDMPLKSMLQLKKLINEKVENVCWEYAKWDHNNE